MGKAWQRQHCVNHMGKTHSKPLATRHGRGTAWARHAMCESALKLLKEYRHQLINEQSMLHIVFCDIKLVNKMGFQYNTVGQGRDSSVGMATHYGLDGPGFESRWEGEIFRTHPDCPWDPPNLLYNGYHVSFPGVKQTGRGVYRPPHLAPRLKKEYSYTSTSPLCLRGLF